MNPDVQNTAIQTTDWHFILYFRIVGSIPWLNPMRLHQIMTFREGVPLWLISVLLLVNPLHLNH